MIALARPDPGHEHLSKIWLSAYGEVVRRLIHSDGHLIVSMAEPGGRGDPWAFGELVSRLTCEVSDGVTNAPHDTVVSAVIAGVRDVLGLLHLAGERQGVGE